MRLIQILLQKGATLLIIMVGKGNIAGRSGRGECLVPSLRGRGKIWRLKLLLERKFMDVHLGFWLIPVKTRFWSRE